MKEIIKTLHRELKEPATDGKKFISELQNHFDQLYNLNAENSGLYSASETELESILQLSFESRINLSKKLNNLVIKDKEEAKELLARVYDMNRALRYLEDYVAEIAMRDRIGVDNKYVTLQGESPYFMVAPGQKLDSLKDLRSGDVILSRGNAFTSAAIARIGSNDTQFSHLTFVYRNPADNNNLYTVEAHIEIGSVVKPIQVHIDQGNSRTVVFRYEDGDLAHKAAEYMYNYVKAQADTGTNIEYNFTMQYNSAERLFCSQVIYEGFWKVSNKAVDIPKFKTLFNPGLIAFLNKLTIPVTPENVGKLDTFSPGDIEYDGRFTLIAEWKDPNALRDSRLKDAILTKMFSWMEEGNYHIHPSMKINLLTRLLWLVRRTPFLKKLVIEKLPLNMGPLQLQMFASLEKIGGAILKQVEAVQNAQEMPLSIKEVFELCEKIREDDKKLAKPLFHNLFHQKE